MRKLFKELTFNLGFTGGFILFALINYLTYIKSYHNLTQRLMQLSAGSFSIGFPFPFYNASYGYPNHFYFDWFGLIADILMAVGFSFVIGLACKIAWSKIHSLRMK